MTIDDPAVFTDFFINTLRTTNQQTVVVITNIVLSFGGLLVVNDGDIDTFSKDTHSVNNSRAAVQRILIGTNVTQGLKSMLFDIKDRELCNNLPDELALRVVNSYQISIIRKSRAEEK